MFQPNDYVDKTAIVEKLYSSKRYKTRTSLSQKLIQGKPGHILNLAIAALDPRKEEKIIEFGAGNGYFSNLIVKAGCKNVLATDLSLYQVERGRAKYPHIQFQVVDLESPPFLNTLFNAAVLNFMLYHLDNPKKALEKVNNLLVPNGRILITTKGTNSYQAIERWHKNTLTQLGLIATYPRDELRVSEKNINRLLPEGMSVEISCQCHAILQFDRHDLIAYLDSTPWTYYDTVEIERRKYHQLMVNLAEKEDFKLERYEWVFLINT